MVGDVGDRVLAWYRRGEAMARVLDLKIKATMWSCVQL